MSIKHLFLIAILFPLALITHAQQISVKSFRALPNDMDARQNYPLKDQNGEICAIIKVQTLEKGFYFDIGSLGITKTEQKPGEIWVYVPHGARKITITHEKFLPLRDYFFTESITEGTCYELVLVSGKVVTSVVENEVESQWLIINTEPAGADVYINDAPTGKTPYQNELPVGKYTYRLQKELYLNEAGVVELLTGSEKKKLDVKMKPNFGSIQLSTTPENGSSVILNGLETGKITPCTFDKLPKGEHTITVSHDMYATATKHITLSAGETLPVSIDLKPTFSEITLHSEPKADLYVNGQMKANASWQGRLTPGIYTFEAKLDKYTTATEKRTVSIGEPLELTLQPIPKTGNLKVISTPMEASIKLDGKDMGQTPATLKNLLIGDYTVELSLAGFAKHSEKTTIAEGQTATLNATLQNGREVSVNSTPTGVDLYIDNQSVGTTPWKGNLIFGEHSLRIQQGEKKAEKIVSITEKEKEGSFLLLLNEKEGLNPDLTKNLKPAPVGVNAEQIIKNYVNALGGEKNLAKVKNVTIHAEATMQNMPITLDIYTKIPDKVLIQVGSGAMVFQKQIYNAGKGVSISPMNNETKPMVADELAAMKEQAILFPEIYYAQLGFTAELLGIEEQKDLKQFYKVLVSKGNGKKDTDYYDVLTSLKMRTESNEQTYSYEHYKAVDGIMFPFDMSQAMGPQAIHFKVDNIILNGKMKDNLFEIK